MSKSKSPLARQKEEFGSKEKLVDRVLAALNSVSKSDEEKDAHKARLLAASNRKLLHLLDSATLVKEKFGSLDKLVEGVAQKQGRGKDKTYVEKLKKFTLGRLVDLHRAASAKQKRAA